ncbi:MAG: ABC transporter substrate-binding protein [Clostridiales bacterium]|nr:ABC transporter substrate-binding protein [Clostridiales bacterium]
MKKLKKVLSVLFAVMLTAALFAGCSSASDTDGDTSSDIKVAILQYMPHSSLDNCTQGVKNALDEANISYEVQIGSSGSADADCQSYAEQMVASDVDLIVAVATPAATAAYSAVQNSSKDIPVIFCAVSDPVAAGLVESMETPGNNTTGTADAFDIEGQVELILELQPELETLGVLYTTSEANSISQIETLQEVCDEAGITLITQGITEASELASAAAALLPKVDAVTNLTDNNVVDNMSVVLERAAELGVPVYGSEIEQVKKGCLGSASIDYVALGEVTGEMAIDVLNGQSAATYSAVEVTESFLVVNTDVAETLGIEIPSDLTDVEYVTTETDENA